MVAPRLTPAALALALAACAPAEQAASDPSDDGSAPADTAARHAAPEDPRVEAVRRRLEQAERDAEARNREALDAARP